MLMVCGQRERYLELKYPENDYKTLETRSCVVMLLVLNEKKSFKRTRSCAVVLLVHEYKNFIEAVQ